MTVFWKSEPPFPDSAVRLSLWRGRTTTTRATNQLIQDIATPNDGGEVWVIPPNLRPGFYFVEIACADKNATECAPGASPAFQVVGAETSGSMAIDLKVDGTDRPLPKKRGSRILISWKVKNVGNCYPNWTTPSVSTIRGDGDSEVVFDSETPKIYRLVCYNAGNDQTISDSVVIDPFR